MVGEERPILREILGRSEIADFEPIIALSASAVTPSKKSSINTNRKYALSNEPKMIIVRCP